LHGPGAAERSNPPSIEAKEKAEARSEEKEN